MLFALANLNPFAARTDEILQRGIQVDLCPHLVKVSHLQVVAQAHLAAIGGQLAQNHLEQGGFASAIGPQQAHFIPPQNGSAEAANDGFIAKLLRNIA